MKYIDEAILYQEINDARDGLELHLRAKGQVSDITPLQEHVAFLPVIVNYISDNFPNNEEIPLIVDEVASFYIQNAISEDAELSKEDIKHVLSVLLREKWTRTQYDK